MSGFSIFDKDGILDKTGELRTKEQRASHRQFVMSGAFAAWGLAIGLTTSQVESLRAKELERLGVEQEQRQENFSQALTKSQRQSAQLKDLLAAKLLELSAKERAKPNKTGEHAANFYLKLAGELKK